MYDGTGGGVMQYWLLHFGPAGTSCPSPRGGKCRPGEASSDGWCPFSFKPGGEVFCVVNGSSAPNAPSTPITSLQQIALTGFAAAGTFSDSISVSIGGTITTASGDNHFPDLASQWQIAEFNVFGDSNNDQAVLQCRFDPCRSHQRRERDERRAPVRRPEFHRQIE